MKKALKIWVFATLLVSVMTIGLACIMHVCGLSIERNLRVFIWDLLKPLLLLEQLTLVIAYVARRLGKWLGLAILLAPMAGTAQVKLSIINPTPICFNVTVLGNPTCKMQCKKDTARLALAELGYRQLIAVDWTEKAHPRTQWMYIGGSKTITAGEWYLYLYYSKSEDDNPWSIRLIPKTGVQ